MTLRGRVALIGIPPRPHYRALFQSLQAYGYEVVLIDDDPGCLFDDVVARHHTTSPITVEGVLGALERAGESERLDGIILFHELTVEISNAVARSLGLPHHPLRTAAAAVDKGKMRQLMAERGVRHPRFAVVETAAEMREAAQRIGYPVVAKPARGGGSYGVTRLDDDAAVYGFFENVSIFWEPKRFVVEEFLPGNELSIETVTSSSGEHVHLCTFTKPESLDGPFFMETLYVSPGLPVRADVGSALDCVLDMITRLDLRRCVTHTEVRLTAAGPVVVEFGMRPIGWPGPLCVREAVGVDLVRIMADLACDSLPALPQPTRVACAGWRYVAVPAAGTVDAVPSRPEVAGLIDFAVWAKAGDSVGVPPDDFNYIKGYLAVSGSTLDEVAGRLAGASVDIEVRPPA